ncbi:leukocyte cell-derived chemotaxin-2-like [Ambystoma mexicanum]|uniref:leukocyte cell-derived chemotaxin-2-like n=1 Tax=Ambystoma mexicanum TaxID=8296 RepID=UPI0037E7EDA9
MPGHFVKILVVVLCATTVAVAYGGTWATMCQSSNRVRGCDFHGCGHFNARRGTRLHKGVDIVCRDGSTVYAPFTGNLQGISRPYSKTNAINDGVKLSGSGFCVKMFYIKPDRYYGEIQKGERLGTMLQMQSVYGGITSHLHVQSCDHSIDPTPNV